MEDGKAVLRANWTVPADAFVLRGPGELSSYNDSARARIHECVRIYRIVCAPIAPASSPARINARMNRESSRYFGKYDLSDLLIIG